MYEKIKAKYYEMFPSQRKEDICIREVLRMLGAKPTDIFWAIDTEGDCFAQDMNDGSPIDLFTLDLSLPLKQQTPETLQAIGELLGIK